MPQDAVLPHWTLKLCLPASVAGLRLPNRLSWRSSFSNGRIRSSRRRCFVRRAKPYSRYSYRHDTDHNSRAEWCAGEHVPCPLLEGPQDVLQHRMQATTPEEVGGGPGQIGVELVVERPGEEEADDVGGQDSSQNVLWRECSEQWLPVSPTAVGAQCCLENVS